MFPGFTLDSPTRHRHLRHTSVLSLFFRGLATRKIGLRTSQAVCGLLTPNATLWNVVELVIRAIALGKCDLDLTQSSLLSGLSSNLLLVLSMAFRCVTSIPVVHASRAPPLTASVPPSCQTLSYFLALSVPSPFIFSAACCMG